MLVEDNVKINTLLFNYLSNEGHHVVPFFDAESAMNYFKTHAVDVLITDLMLPKMQGEDLIAFIRKISDVYLIVTTAKGDLQARLHVLELGADDCIVKPFSFDEVKIKLQNVEKRLSSTIHTSHPSTFYVNALTRKVYVKDNEIVLTPKEYEIMHFLFSHPKQVMSREQIIYHCELKVDAVDRTVDVLIKNIRQKIKEVSKIDYIKTHYSMGYSYEGDKHEKTNE